MKAPGRLWAVPFTILVVFGALKGTQAACEGNSCPEQARDAHKAGLLGGAVIKQCSQTKDYPTDGTKLQPTNFEAPIVDLRWAGLDHEVDRFVFAITEASDQLVGGHVWRSDKYGQAGSWVDVTQQMEGALTQQDEAGGDMAGILDLYFHEDHPEKILFAGPGYFHWVTSDFGRTFTKVDTPGKTLGYWHEIKIHPTRPQWVLAKVRRQTCEQWDASTNPWCAFDLFLTQDFGHKWVNLTANSGGAVASFWDFDWGATLHRSDKRAFVDETILATVYESPAAMKGPYPGWDKDIHFVVSHDFFKSAHSKLVSCGNQFELIGQKVFLALPTDCPTQPDGSYRKVQSGSARNSVVLYASDDEGLSFEQVCLPVKNLDLGYNLVRTHDGSAAFLIVDHDEEEMITARAPIGNIYAPGYNNTLYTLSMSRNFRRRYVTDFARVEGVPGVYLANQLSSKVINDPAAMRSADFAKFIQSKISFNGGGKWEDLAKPDHFRHAECNRCSGMHDPSKCQLHLHGPSSWHDGPEGRPSFYTHDNAPGIVMAVGNMGEYLDFAADAMCTWLSRDGGATWEDVAPHACIYEYGDHGGLLLLASHETEGPTDRLQFSLDQGACWHNILLAEAIDIQNIRVEPKAASHVFVVHGQACLHSPAHPTCTHTKEGVKPAGKSYVVDLKPILGSDWRDCSAADYERWSPPKPEVCLLGKNVTMERRRRASDCFNGKEYERAETAFTLCPCDTMDVECEFGYEYVNSECHAITGLDAAQCGAVSDGRYHASASKHRLIQGDACADISRVITDTDGKGNLPGGRAGGAHGARKKWATAFVAFLVMAIAGVSFSIWWFMMASDGAKATLEEFAAPVVGACASAWGWLVDSALALKDRLQGGARRGLDDEASAYFQPLASGDDFGLDADPEEAHSPVNMNGHA